MKKSIITTTIFLALHASAHAENLFEIYQTALSKDPQYQAAIAQKNSAFEKITEADAAKLPQINLTGGVGYLKSNRDDYYTSRTASSELALTQALFRKSIWTNSDIVTKQAMATDVAMNLEKQNLMLRTVQAYFSVLASQDALSYAKANEQALLKQQDETKERMSAGVSSITDVQEAKAAHDMALADIITAENNLANSFESLRQITGSEYQLIDSLDTERFSPSELNLNATGWLKNATDQSLALNQVRIEKDIAKQQIDLAKTGHLPTLDLKLGTTSNYTNYQENTASKEDGAINEGTIGLQFSLPLYSGGATESQVKQAQYNYVAASEKLEKAYRDMQVDIYKNYNNVFASIGMIKAYQQSVLSAQSALEATEAGYQAGTRTVVDVLGATSKLYSAKQKLSEARFNYIIGMIQLKLTSGDLAESDLLAINQGLKRN